MSTEYKIPDKHKGKIPAISVRQPWAEMIMYDIKDLEIRTWRTNYRGPILIHASNTLPTDDTIMAGLDIGCTVENIERMDRGCYLGIAEVNGCFKYTEENCELELREEWAMEFGTTVWFKEPISGKGAANFFYPTDADWKKLEFEVTKAIERQEQIREIVRRSLAQA